MATEQKLKIAIGADHAGFAYKEMLKQNLGDFDVVDFGTTCTDAVDYPDFAHKVAEAVSNKSCDFGILICGSANGVAITANKHQDIRAAICWENDLAQLARQHNDANIICIPARFVSPHVAAEMLETFLHTAFEGGRHLTRVDKIPC